MRQYPCVQGHGRVWPCRPETSTSVAIPLDWTVIEPARPIALRRREYLHESELCADGSRESDDVKKLENSG